MQYKLLLKDYINDLMTDSIDERDFIVKMVKLSGCWDWNLLFDVLKEINIDYANKVERILLIK